MRQWLRNVSRKFFAWFAEPFLLGGCVTIWAFARLAPVTFCRAESWLPTSPFFQKVHHFPGIMMVSLLQPPRVFRG
jgi:hypothetical protein